MWYSVKFRVRIKVIGMVFGVDLKLATWLARVLTIQSNCCVPYNHLFHFRASWLKHQNSVSRLLGITDKDYARMDHLMTPLKDNLLDNWSLGP